MRTCFRANIRYLLTLFFTKKLVLRFYRQTMSQVPSNAPNGSTNNDSQWLSPDNILFQQHQLSNQQQFPTECFQNWGFPTTNYSQNVPFLPPQALIPNNETSNQHPSRKRAASSTDEDENDENQSPPQKATKHDEELKYLELSSPSQQQYNGQYLQQVTSNQFAQSTPKAPYSYLSKTLITLKLKSNQF